MTGAFPQVAICLRALILKHAGNISALVGMWDMTAK